MLWITASKSDVFQGKGSPGACGAGCTLTAALEAALERTGQSRGTWQQTVIDTQEEGFFRVMFPLGTKGADYDWISVVCSTESAIHHTDISKRVPLIRDPISELYAHPLSDRVRASPSLSLTPTKHAIILHVLLTSRCACWELLAGTDRSCSRNSCMSVIHKRFAEDLRPIAGCTWHSLQCRPVQQN